MLPQILQQLAGAAINPQIKQMAQAFKTAGNPQALLNQMIQTNPQMKQVMDFVRASGGDPRAVFYRLAEQRGINPQAILDQLK